MTNAKSFVRGALLLAGCALLPAAAWAARPVPVFEVDVAGQSDAALQQAMRDALVRATGRREAATDPAFGGLVADAAKYVQSYARGPQGELQVVFNGAAVEKAIAALDRATWDPDRPFTLVVIYPPAAPADEGPDRAGLEQAAEQRGLPISIVPLPVADGGGNLLSREALLQMAHHYGAEQLLIGRPPALAAPPPASGAALPGSAARPGSTALPGGAAPLVTGGASRAGAAAPTTQTPAASTAGQPTAPAPAALPAAGGSPGTPGAAEWQWTLFTDFTSQSWRGSLTTGIDGTVNLLAPPAGAVAANVPGETEIEIEGVSTLADYANIEQMLGAVPGVRRANVREVEGDSVVFDLTVRGGAAAIDRALSSSPSFTRVRSSSDGGAAAPQPAPTAGAPLVYRYRPG